MKKLLSLLGAVVVTASGASGVVACGTSHANDKGVKPEQKPNHKDDNNQQKPNHNTDDQNHNQQPIQTPKYVTLDKIVADAAKDVNEGINNYDPNDKSLDADNDYNIVRYENNKLIKTVLLKSITNLIKENVKSNVGALVMLPDPNLPLSEVEKQAKFDDTYSVNIVHITNETIKADNTGFIPGDVTYSITNKVTGKTVGNDFKFNLDVFGKMIKNLKNMSHDGAGIKTVDNKVLNINLADVKFEKLQTLFKNVNAEQYVNLVKNIIPSKIANLLLTDQTTIHSAFAKIAGILKIAKGVPSYLPTDLLPIFNDLEKIDFSSIDTILNSNNKTNDSVNSDFSPAWTKFRDDLTNYINGLVKKQMPQFIDEKHPGIFNIKIAGVEVDVNLPEVIDAIAPDLLHAINYFKNYYQDNNVKATNPAWVLLEYLCNDPQSTIIDKTKNINDGFGNVSAVNDGELKAFFKDNADYLPLIHTNLGHWLADLLGSSLISNQQGLWTYHKDGADKLINSKKGQPFTPPLVIKLDMPQPATANTSSKESVQSTTSKAVQSVDSSTAAGKQMLQTMFSSLLKKFQLGAVVKNIQEMLPTIFNWKDITRDWNITVNSDAFGDLGKFIPNTNVTLYNVGLNKFLTWVIKTLYFQNEDVNVDITSGQTALEYYDGTKNVEVTDFSSIGKMLKDPSKYQNLGWEIKNLSYRVYLPTNDQFAYKVTDQTWHLTLAL